MNKTKQQPPESLAAVNTNSSDIVGVVGAGRRRGPSVPAGVRMKRTARNSPVEMRRGREGFLQTRECRTAGEVLKFTRAA